MFLNFIIWEALKQIYYWRIIAYFFIFFFNVFSAFFSLFYKCKKYVISEIQNTKEIVIYVNKLFNSLLLALAQR